MDLQDLRQHDIGFIGGGNMARAIALPLIKKGIILPQNVWVSAATQTTLDFWSGIDDQNPVNTTLDNSIIIQNCDIVFLAMKPQYLEVALSIFPLKQPDDVRISRIFVSVLAGVTLSKLQEQLREIMRFDPPIMRTIPNTALSISEGITVYCCNQVVTEGDRLPVVTLLSQLGLVQEVPESQMDVAGALTGSGPAFVYLMIEALSDGAVKNGLPRALATKLAAQMLAGAGKMVAQTGKHPGQLKDEVCSPGGTTIAGIHALEGGGVRGSLMNAIEAAVKRSKELGSQ